MNQGEPSKKYTEISTGLKANKIWNINSAIPSQTWSECKRIPKRLTVIIDHPHREIFGEKVKIELGGLTVCWTGEIVTSYHERSGCRT